MPTIDYVGVGALLVSLLTAYVTLSPIRNELSVCKRERLELRRRLELVTAAIIATLPPAARLDLLLELGERVDVNGDHGAG